MGPIMNLTAKTMEIKD